MLCSCMQIEIEFSVAGGGAQHACQGGSLHQLQKPSAASGYSVNMQLTPLGSCRSQARPQGSAVAKATTPIPRPSKAAAAIASSVADSSCDIHRLLESYSRHITKTGIIYDCKCIAGHHLLQSQTFWRGLAEGEIDLICQQQQEVLQV